MNEMTRVSCVKAFFEKDARPVSNTEFMTFWKACNEEERKEFGIAASQQLGVTLKD